MADPALGLADARALERRFAFFYLAFALLFGAFSARAFQVATSEAHMLIVGLMFGYGAGVAAGISMRPKIAIPSLVIAILPAAITALLTSRWRPCCSCSWEAASRAWCNAIAMPSGASPCG
jgi:hypothetical protein